MNKIPIEIVVLFFTSIIAALGYIGKRFIIDPILELRKNVKDLHKELIEHKGIYSNCSISDLNIKDNAANSINNKKSLLKASIECIPLYSVWASLSIVPKKGNIDAALKAVNGIASSCYQSNYTHVEEYLNEIESNLKIKI